MIVKKDLSNRAVRNRLSMIQNGAGFGERDPYSSDCYYPYSLIGVLCPVNGEIVVEDLSVKHRRIFITDVMSTYIEGAD